MSFIHYLTAGYLDEDALRWRHAVALRPLPLAEVEAVLGQYGERSDEGWLVGGAPLKLHDGLVTGGWYGGVRTLEAERFFLALCERTGCALADVPHARLVPLEELHRSRGSQDG